MASGIVRAQACGAEMGKVPVKCRACARACPNGCEVEGRKKRGSGQSHNDKKGDHGDRHETKRSGHLPAAPLAPEEVLQNEENEEKQQEVEGNEEELEESSPLTTAEKNCHLLVVLVAAAMLVLIDFQLSKKIISGLWNYNNS